MMRKLRRSVAPLAVLVGLSSSACASTQTADAVSTPTLRFAGKDVTLTMQEKGGRSMIEVYIGDAGPYDFIIDTGAGLSVIDQAIAIDLGLEVTRQMEVGVPGGPQVEANLVRAPLLRVGELEIVGVTPVTLGLVEMSGGLIHGILGMEIFRDVLLTLDPAGDRAVISRGRLTPEAPGVLPLDQSDGKIAFSIEVAGQPIPIHIDTGSGAGFTLPIERIDDFPTLDVPARQRTAGLVGGSRQIHIRQLDGLIRFAGLEYENPEVGFMDPSPPTGNLGLRILDQLTIGIDQRSGLISFRTADESAVKRNEPRRLGLGLGGPGSSDLSTVSSVDQGGLADQAGLRAGDVILTLNGRPMSAYDQQTLGALLRGAESLTFEIEREGDLKLMRIP
jgi:hypothetical protein